MPKSTTLLIVSITAEGMRLPPGVPTTITGLPSFVTMVGLMELSRRLPGAIAFAVQAVMLAIVGSLRPGATVPSDTAGRWGWRPLLVFGLALQPLIGPLLGRPWGQVEVFGMAPDPTVTVTLAMLAKSQGDRLSVVLWPIPMLWCAASAATLWTMHDRDAWVMPAVAVAALATASLSRRQ